MSPVFALGRQTTCCNNARQLCYACAPDIQTELASAQVQPTIDQMHEKLREAPLTKGMDLATEAPAPALPVVPMRKGRSSVRNAATKSPDRISLIGEVQERTLKADMTEANPIYVPDVEQSVRERYSRGAQTTEPALCCPVSYDERYLKAIPPEVIERDYGCGDPSQYLREGETVLDLGSGTGKICFIASQVVGPQGKVIGVDMNDDMLGVARRNAPIAALNIGYANVEFRKGRIQDLALDLQGIDEWLSAHPVRTVQDWSALEAHSAELRATKPMIPENSVDVVVSNCVLNLVRPEDKVRLFQEIYRVLRSGGRAVISDIVSDEDVPLALRNDPELWSGCIAGALREDRFLQAFEEAGFYGITVLQRQATPWRTVQGIEFRSITVAAYKGKDGACFDHKQAVIYKGPFKEVTDDDGHVLRRGTRVAVCEKTFSIYSRAPYMDHFDFVEPANKVQADKAQPFPCANGMLVRHPRDTKGEDYRLTTGAGETRCGPGTGCC